MHIARVRIILWIWICIGLVLRSVQVNAQSNPKISKETKATLRLARKYYRSGDFRDAVEEYEKIIDEFSDDKRVNFELGVSYLHSYQQPKDLDFLEKSYKLDGKKDKKIYYWLGRANHLNYNFGKAKINYEKYLNQLRVFQRAQKKDIDNLMEQSRYAKELCEKPQRYIIEKVYGGINTEFSEHSPITSLDGSTLIYTSRHPNEVNNMDMDVAGEYREKIYWTTKDDSGQWKKPILLNIDPEFKNHLATMQLFDHGRKMLLYKSTHHGDIYVSEKKNDTSWTSPVPFGNINSTEWEADVYLSRKDDIVFLSTDRFTKDGNLDIYMSVMQDDSTWGELINLGDNVNTPFDENSPFLSNDGRTLFFSSNGHKSMGGYDVFKVELDTVTREWGKPVNMGYPINTPDDDVYFYFGYNGWTGYTSSYRTGGLGEKDIYKITFVPNVNVVGNIYNGETMELMEDVNICFEAIFTDTNFVECDLTNELDGKYNVNILSYQPYHVYFIKNGDTLEVKEYEVPFLVEGDPTYYLKDFYLFKDPDTTKEESLLITGTTRNRYNEHLNGVEIEVIDGNMDPVGTEISRLGSYGIHLGKNTPEGIESSHLVMASYKGMYLSKIPEKESKRKYRADFMFDLDAIPLTIRVKDEKSDVGLEDVKIVVTNNENREKSTYVITEKDFSIAVAGKQPEEQVNYTISVSKPGYEDKVIEVQQVLKKSGNEVIIELTPIPMQPLVAKKIEKKDPPKGQEEILRFDENGNLKKIRNVYFGFDKIEVGKQYVTSLDTLASILNNSEDIIVKILGHADDKGSDGYNVKLSHKRAQAVRTYLMERKVGEDKVVLKAMGEKFPLVSNDDEIDGRELNRRVEFVIYRMVK